MLVPKCDVDGVRRSERICRLKELGWGILGPGPQVSEVSKRGALPMVAVDAVSRCLLLITCLPRLDVFQGVRKSDPPLEKSTLGLAGSRVELCCSLPVYCLPVDVIDIVFKDLVFMDLVFILPFMVLVYELYVRKWGSEGVRETVLIVRNVILMCVLALVE